MRESPSASRWNGGEAEFGWRRSRPAPMTHTRCSDTGIRGSRIRTPTRACRAMSPLRKSLLALMHGEGHPVARSFPSGGIGSCDVAARPTRLLIRNRRGHSAGAGQTRPETDSSTAAWRILAVVLATLGLHGLKPAAPRVDRAAVWIDSVQRGPAGHRGAGSGHARARADPVHLRGDGRAGWSGGWPRPARK